THDLAGLHPGRVAAGHRAWRGRGEPALARYRRVRRDAVRDLDRHLLHSALLPCHRGARGATPASLGRLPAASISAISGGSVIRAAPLLALAALTRGCAAGPSYHPEQPVPPATRVGTARSSDSVAAFFDSLAAARSRDTAVAGAVPPVPERALQPDSAAALA